MNQGLFLVASIDCDLADRDYAWLTQDTAPYESGDPIDFLGSDDLFAIYKLYKAHYRGIDSKLNIPMPEGLIEFNRWIVFRSQDGRVVAFAGFKTTRAGLKLGLAATDGCEASKSALKALLRRGLNAVGVYAEVSGGIERVVTGWVPEVDPSLAAALLSKQAVACSDRRHYTRTIVNVGKRQKLLVGRPLSCDP